MKLNRIYKSVLTALAFVGLTAMTASVSHAQVQYYYSGMLLQTNFYDSTGSTNPVLANFPQSGPWLSTKGIVIPDQNAIGYTLQIVTAQTTTNAPQYATNVVVTLAPILDDFSVVNRYPAATNHQFTVTFTASANTTNKFTDIAFIAATNTLGAKQFEVINVNYAGTNPLTIYSLRGGFWY